MARLLRVLLLLGLVVPAAASGQTAFTRKTVNLRAGPSIEFPVVSRIGPGAPVQVFGCVDDWTWCDVAFGPERGWVYAGNLAYPYQDGRVTILSNGPLIGLPIITFSIGPYWDSYYHGRPWYGRRSYWIGRPPPRHWIGHPPSHRPPSHRPPAPQPPNPPRPQPHPQRPPPHPRPPAPPPGRPAPKPPTRPEVQPPKP